MMKHFTASAAAMAALLITSPALAADRDGSLPLYPHGTVAAGMGGIPANALAQGVPYQQTTSDSVSTVDAWYKSNVPKSCTRLAASGGVRYTCPGGTIVIQNHNGTLISLLPAMPHF